MNCISISLYRKMINRALIEGMTRDEFDDFPNSIDSMESYLFEEVLGDPENQEVSHDVEKVLGRKATDFSAYVAKTVDTGIWNQQIPQSI